MLEFLIDNTFAMFGGRVCNKDIRVQTVLLFSPTCSFIRMRQISTFPFICSNFPAAPVNGVYISQLIPYSRACGLYQDFLDRGLLLTRKLLNHVFLLVTLKSSLRKFYGRLHDLVDRYAISVSLMTTDMFHLPVLSSFMTYHRVCN
jgi:hypothetical protein